MTIAQMLDTVQFVIDGAGERRAVLLDIAMWEDILRLLEDLEDAEELRRAVEEDDEVIPWEQVKADYLAAHNV